MYESIIPSILGSKDLTAYEGYLLGSVLDCLCRFEKPHGVEELEKACGYLELLKNEVNFLCTGGKPMATAIRDVIHSPTAPAARTFAGCHNIKRDAAQSFHVSYREYIASAVTPDGEMYELCPAMKGGKQYYITCRCDKDGGISHRVGDGFPEPESNRTFAVGLFRAWAEDLGYEVAVSELARRVA